MLPPIFILEGPSGSGKTTFMKTLRNMGKLQLVELPVEVPRPRAYEFEDKGIRLSSLKDMLHIWSALTTETQLPLGIDRGFLSQQVYGVIRGSLGLASDFPSLSSQQTTASGTRFHIRKLMNWILEDLEDRGGPAQLLPDFHFVFYLPSPEIIQDRRNHATGREYPYPVLLEHHLYSELYSKWVDSATLIQDGDDERKFINDFLL